MVKFPSRVKKPANHGKQVAGIAAGAALIGAVGAALFTPKSGKEVRKDIVKGGKVAAKKAEETVNVVEEKLHLKDKKPTTVKKTVKRTAKPAKKPVTKARTTTKPTAKSTK